MLKRKKKKKLVRIFDCLVVLSRHKFSFQGLFHRALKLRVLLFMGDWKERWLVVGTEHIVSALLPFLCILGFPVLALVR